MLWGSKGSLPFFWPESPGLGPVCCTLTSYHGFIGIFSSHGALSLPGSLSGLLLPAPGTYTSCRVNPTQSALLDPYTTLVGVLLMTVSQTKLTLRG